MRHLDLPLCRLTLMHRVFDGADYTLKGVNAASAAGWASVAY